MRAWLLSISKFGGSHAPSKASPLTPWHFARTPRERQRSAAAQRLLSQLSGQYTEQRWSGIEAYLHSRSAELQASLDMPRDQLLSTLALVRAGVPAGAEAWALDELLQDPTDRATQNAELAKNLMQDVHRLSGALTKGGFSSSAVSLVDRRFHPLL